MRRTDIRQDDGTWTGLSLEVRSPSQPGLCLFSTGRRLLLAQQSQPVLLAHVGRDHGGVDFWRTDGYRSPVPALRADSVRTTAGRPDRWAHHFARYLLGPGSSSPLHDGRWLLSRDSPLPHWNHDRVPQAEYWSSMLVEGHPDGHVDWWAHAGSWEVLPLRPMPEADDGRVKAYRKQVRDGTLPPVLLWWVSGLDCHLVLDGHARLAAAIAESAVPPLLQLHRTAPSDEVATGTERAVHRYETEMARFEGLRRVHGTAVPDGAAVAGPDLARRLRDLGTAPARTWSWPLPGGEDRWHRVAQEVTGGRWPAGDGRTPSP